MLAMADDDLAVLRRDFGRATVLWGGEKPDHVVEDGYWHTISGVRHGDFNAACCSAVVPERLQTAMRRLNNRRHPGFVALAGAGLGLVNGLVDAGWSCATTSPLMVRTLESGAGRDRAVVRPGLERLGELRSLMAETFGYPGWVADLAVPDSTARGPRVDGGAPKFSAWALELDGEYVCGALSSSVGETATIWSMATPSRLRRRGYASRLLEGMFDGLARDGRTRAALLATRDGAPLYRAMGFATAEVWQVFTPRKLMPIR